MFQKSHKHTKQLNNIKMILKNMIFNCFSGTFCVFNTSYYRIYFVFIIQEASQYPDQDHFNHSPINAKYKKEVSCTLGLQRKHCWLNFTFLTC